MSARTDARWRTPARALAASLAVLVLAGCAQSKTISRMLGGESDEILPGKRESALLQSDALQPDPGLAGQPIVMPAAIVNPNWPQPGGAPSNAMGNLAVGPQLARVWSVSAGSGSDGYGRLIASPIAVGGRIYVLDTKARVHALAMADGARQWSRSLVPKGQDEDGAFGGGLASDGQRIIAITAFGEAVGLDAGSGQELWRKKLGAPVRASPTVADNRVYAVAVSNEVYCLSAGDGSQLWRYQGTGEQASLVASPSPAVAQGMVVVPSTAGDLIALRTGDGIASWNDSLAGSASTKSAASLKDIAGRPVIDAGQVFAISHQGRMVSINLATGQRLWQQEITGSQMPWVTGDTVFVLSGRDTLLALSRKEGRVRWAVTLPGGKSWSGPVLGGGRLLAVSAEGQLLALSPQTGETLHRLSVGGVYYLAPIIANGMVFLLSDAAQLTALR